MLSSEIITSRNNPLVKYAASLLDKKGRRAERAFIAEGLKLCLEAIETGMPITHVLVCENNVQEIIPRITRALSDADLPDVAISVLSVSAFEKISTEKAPQGVITVIKHLDFSINADIIYKEEFFLTQNEKAIALCSVRDPSNLGAVIRSAVAFGVDKIVLSPDCADVYNTKTVRSAMGSLFRVKIITVGNMEDFVAKARDNGRRVFAAELTEGAISLSDITLLPTDVMIIGNEGHGIPASLSKACNGSVYIPIGGGVESLNASVAASVLIWEQFKR